MTDQSIPADPAAPRKVDDRAAGPGTAARGEPVAAPGEARAAEIGGRNGPDPTRYGDWELRGRCIDF